MQRHLAAVAVLVVAASGAGAVLPACGSGGSGSATGGAGAARHASAGAGVVAVDEHADGTTVTLRPDQQLEVTLHSTYWTLAAPDDAAVLRVDIPPTPATDASCRSAIPGSGCGSVTATYTAARAGSTTLTAHRDTCGEALRCVGAQADWRVTVRVS
jgi:hypothetical protein